MIKPIINFIFAFISFIFFEPIVLVVNFYCNIFFYLLFFNSLGIIIYVMYKLIFGI